MKNPMAFNKFVNGMILFVFSFLFFIFQNCSDVSIAPIEQPQVVAKSTTSGSFCSTPPQLDGDILNVIFVLDMSGSNIEYPTDLPGKRFDVIENFVDMDCANKNAGNKFAIIGFSDKTFLECSAAALKSPNLVKPDIANLKQIQESDVAIRDGGGNPLNMTQTHYLKGVDCASNIISSHISDLPEEEKQRNAYLVFFLTDGVPTDYGTPSQVRIDQVKSTLSAKFDDLHEFGRATAGFRLQPILYGKDKLADIRPDQLGWAEDIINFLAEKGDSIPRTVNDVNDIPFCETLKSGRKTQFVVREFAVTNLTAVMKQGRLLADSDMDGLSDDEEIERGFDPTRPRSSRSGNLLLDGLCPKGLPAHQCPLRETCQNANFFGLTDCDLGTYSLTDGIDTDRDDIPDIIELLKGSSPNNVDLIKNLDGDSLTLVEEILRYGRDPNFPDDHLDPSVLLDYTHTISPTPIGECPVNQESWTYKINSLPLVSTLKTSPDDRVSSQIPFLKHEADKNIVLIYYIVGKSNEIAEERPIRYIFGKFLEVDLQSSKVTELTEFMNMGKINGNFVSQ
ncbi:MAG: VWA domain-containing protein [Bdellovibrionales bacterium]|nr:VWA domain-containing protein [Bdellovibrionales bacterium]